MCEKLGRYSFFITSAPLNVKGGIACKYPFFSIFPFLFAFWLVGGFRELWTDGSAAELFGYILGGKFVFWTLTLEYEMCLSNDRDEVSALFGRPESSYWVP
jgi:hypothetical protein